MPAALCAPVLFVLFVLNTLLWIGPVYLAVLVKLLTPSGTRARDALSRAVAWLAEHWMMVNVWVGDRVLRIDWDVRAPVDLSRNGQYLIIANHQTWNDIYVLMRCFRGRLPFFKFFLKQQLIWVPVLGLAWWGLDYPFMKRYTREQIERDPSLRGKDVETTRKACEKYARLPVSILNFLEGTRFTPAKHARQHSPYVHLLKPKAGGIAFALSAMGDKLTALLDVTIAYPDGVRTFWEFLGGKVRRVIVEVRALPVPDGFVSGNYTEDPEFRARVQTWVRELWEEKDVRLAALLGESQR
ncbi:MAG: acyltransferase [Nevskiaceae bacterium]|nr:MAG: acyltransferase [Nevskiaceae bacterium]TBR74337.1 MAG: acyltransferase [Nevskiaceae bacterium]